MEPDSVRTRNLSLKEGFSIGSELECGHGIVTLAEDGIAEVEMIAFSKDARYFCVRVVAERDCTVRLRVVPDRRAGFSLDKFHSWVWIQEESKSDWTPLSGEALKIGLSHMEITFPLKAGEIRILSSEQRLPYSETRDWVQSLAGVHGFEIVSVGHSVEGREILALQRRKENSGKPFILVLAGEHGTEFAGEYMARGMLEAVMEESPMGASLRKDYDWAFILNANPDGNVNGWHQYNRTDWEQHRYPFPGDISWHHEYAAFLTRPDEQVCPEAEAIGSYVLDCLPALIVNMHSWQGNDGDLGGYRAGISLQHYPQLMGVVDDIARQLAEDCGVNYRGKDSGNLASGHLGDTLAGWCGIPSISPEGHMKVGEKKLHRFGREWLIQVIQQSGVSETLQGLARQVEERYGRLPRMERVRGSLKS